MEGIGGIQNLNFFLKFFHRTGVKFESLLSDKFLSNNVSHSIVEKEKRSRYLYGILCFIQVPLGIIEKNETYTEQMIEILSEYQEYVPDVKGYRLQVSGDGLTCMRAMDAIRARANGRTLKERIQKIFVSSLDWHEQVNVLQVSCLQAAFYPLPL